MVAATLGSWLPFRTTVNASTDVLSLSVGINQKAPAPAPTDVIDNGDGTYTYKNKWLSSYETLLFDTKDGDLDADQYAIDETGEGYYIRTKPKDQAQFDYVPIKDDKGNVYDVSKLTEVKIVKDGHAYYDEFLTADGAKGLWDDKSLYFMADPSQLPSGSVLRVQSNAKKYWDTAQIKNYPQPEKTEIVTEIPPAEPIPEEPEHHSIALDVASNSGAKTNTSSYSWSHTCTGSNLLLVVGVTVYNSLTDKTVTGITYNAKAMGSIRSDVDTSSYKVRSALYDLVAPDSGSSYTIAVTLSGTSTESVGGATSYTGAAQSGQPDNNNGNHNYNKLTATVTVSTIANNCWVFSVVNDGYHKSLACGNTERWNVHVSNHFGGGSDTNSAVPASTNQTMNWTIGNDGGNVGWAISAASFAPLAVGTAVLTGTVISTPAITEADVVAGGKTIIITLTGDTWVATVGQDNAITTALIAGIDSAQSEAAGWDAVVKAHMVYTDVVRTSSTVVTVTLGDEATYDITATETITVTIPASAVTLGAQIVATPTFTVTAVTLPDIAIDKNEYDFGVVDASATPYTTTSYFTIDNNSSMQTDQTISVTTSTWGGGAGWTHSENCTPAADTAGLKANKGGDWGTGDIIVKNSSPNYIAENQQANTDYSFGLKLWAPTSYTISNYQEKSITVRITVAAG